MTSQIGAVQWFVWAIAGGANAEKAHLRVAQAARMRREHSKGTRANMINDAQENHRQELLGVLFGTDVPQGLEGQLLRTSDVATLFLVSERTVSEWAKRGQIPSVRTPGGHRRYPADGIRALLQVAHQEGMRADDDRAAPATVTDLSDRRPASA